MDYPTIITPKISVVIPIFNCPNYIEDALESVFSQTLKPIEIIVVNDGSTDNTIDTLRKFSKKIICIQQENRGPASARNNGINHAKGDFIAFLDSDDIWLPNKLERQMELFESNPDLGMVYSPFVYFGSANGIDVATLPKRFYSGQIFEKLLIESFILMSSVIVRSRTLTAIGMFDESLVTAEDTNLYLKIAKRWHIRPTEDVLVKHRIHVGNLSSRTDVPIGTLKNLDRIVALYPETAPEIYPPMKKAYLSRGRRMMSDLFSAAEYRTCRRVAIRMHHFNPFDLPAMKYFFFSFFPSRIIDYARYVKRYLNMILIKK